MRFKHWLALAVIAAVLAIAIPPLFFYYYEGPRESRTPDGLWATTMRHGGELSVELSSQPPHAQPTRSQIEAASELLEATTRLAEPWRDYDYATARGGFTVSNADVLGRPDTRFYHLFNPEYMQDDRTLDPSRPESLVYHNAPDGLRLVGVMYMVEPGEHGPQPGGPLTRWHQHPVVEFCMDQAGVPTVAAEDGVRGGCPQGESNGPTPEMMHVWMIDNPHGAFAHRMALPDDHTAMHASAPNPWSEFVRRLGLWIRERV